MDNAKIEAALAALDGAGVDIPVSAGFPPVWFDTGLTVADLRELLEAARDGGWRDASEPPGDGRAVEVERMDGRTCRASWLPGGDWLSIEYGLISVRRWRELPR